ncbi:MAG: NAD(P)/FAD-dependent oxidoreductase [Jatrophihabitans sp.]|uniref:NAD(P)/FAD-dependent oxidoreductase n=1 Tax=Jatrophihabitans sp. TaxID=1932789 RepID=UPI003F7FE084
MRHLVVVGASLAGLRAVEAARRHGHPGPITLVGAEPHLPYDRPPLSKAFLDATGPASVVPLQPEAHLRDELGVELLLGTPATALDTDACELHLGDRTVSYDELIIATGASPHPFPGLETTACLPRQSSGTPGDGWAGGRAVSGVHSLRTFDDALAIRAALDAGARTVVVGAGFIGSEVASAARKRGLPVTVVEAAPVPLQRSVGPELGAVCADLHRANGTDLRLDVGVARLESAGGRVTGVRLADGTLLPADLVVLGIGVAPNTAWLQGSGVALHEHDGGVLADATLATGAPHVWAAGDVVHAPNPLFDDDLLRLEHWTNAAEQGAAAARHAVDPAAAAPLASVPYFWSDWYGHRLQFVGMPRADETWVANPGDVDATAHGFLALYRRGDRVVGALSIDRPREIMKYRARIAQRGRWDDTVAFAHESGAGDVSVASGRSG